MCISVGNTRVWQYVLCPIARAPRAPFTSIGHVSGFNTPLSPQSGSSRRQLKPDELYARTLQSSGLVKLPTPVAPTYTIWHSSLRRRSANHLQPPKNWFIALVGARVDRKLESIAAVCCCCLLLLLLLGNVFAQVVLRDGRGGRYPPLSGHPSYAQLCLPDGE